MDVRFISVVLHAAYTHTQLGATVEREIATEL